MGDEDFLDLGFLHRGLGEDECRGRDAGEFPCEDLGKGSGGGAGKEFPGGQLHAGEGDPLLAGGSCREKEVVLLFFEELLIRDRAVG